jgi:DNA-binding response OmpR family regulator
MAVATSVLVVDDEANIRELVSVYLTAAGYSVATASDGAAAVEAARADEPDLIVLDIGLPGMSGAEVCSAIRGFSSVPIVMLTARSTDLDKVALLEAGADDYVVKPFSPPELVARVRAVLRRTSADPAENSGPASGQSTETVVSVGGLKLDAEAREVTVDGVPVAVTAREFDLLIAMARRPGVVFSREQLLEVALGFSEYLEARGVDVHVRHLREKLGDDAATPRFIETVRGVGYRVKRDAT